MTKCGIDVGSTLIKVAVPAIGGMKFFSTKDMSKATLIQKLISMGVTQANVTGIGKYDLPFKFARAMGNPVANEIRTQLIGTRYLLKSWNYSDYCEVSALTPQDYCLISIGTGASFANVTGDYHQHLPYGSCIAGGWLNKIANHVFTDRTTYSNDEQTIRTVDGYAQVAFKEKRPSNDLCIKDVFESEDDQFNELVIAACGKLPPPWPAKDYPSIALSLVNSMVLDIFSRLLMYRYFNEVRSDNVVLVGSIASLKSVQMLFRRLALFHGITTWIPSNADYAGACGALLSHDDEFISLNDVTERPRRALAALKAAASSTPSFFHFSHQ